MTPKKLFQYIFISLLLGLFTTNIIDNKILGFGIVVIPLFLIFRKIYKSSEDKFDFLLFIFALSHFTSYMENQGGLWLIMTMIIFLFDLYNIVPRFLHIHIVLKFLIAILFLYDILGLLFVNEMENGQIAQYFLIFTNLLLIFIFASTIKYSKEKLVKLFKVCFVLAIISFFIALNQKYLLFPLPNTAMIPLRVDFLGEFGTSRASSMINDYELFAEYSLLSFVLFFPNIIFKNKDVPLKYSHLIIFSLICVVNIILSGTRSTIVLIVTAFILYGIISIIYKKSPTAIIKMSTIAFFLILVILAVGIYIGTDVLFQRFSDSDVYFTSLSDLSEGKGINREEVFLLGINRLNEFSWNLGYGFGTLESNRIAWFGSLFTPYHDYHNIYLSLPILFGWGGALAFLLIIFTILFRLMLALKRIKDIRNPFIANIIIGLIVFWSTFLVHEYKINILRNLHYVMLIFIWLGISNSMANKIDYEDKNHKL